MSVCSTASSFSFSVASVETDCSKCAIVAMTETPASGIVRPEESPVSNTATHARRVGGMRRP